MNDDVEARTRPRVNLNQFVGSVRSTFGTCRLFPFGSTLLQCTRTCVYVVNIICIWMDARREIFGWKLRRLFGKPNCWAAIMRLSELRLDTE